MKKQSGLIQRFFHYIVVSQWHIRVIQRNGRNSGLIKTNRGERKREEKKNVELKQWYCQVRAMWRAQVKSVDNVPTVCHEMLIWARIWNHGRDKGIRRRPVSPPDSCEEYWFSRHVYHAVWQQWEESPWHSRPKRSSSVTATIADDGHRPTRENFCWTVTWMRHRWRENSSETTTQFHYRLQQGHR